MQEIKLDSIFNENKYLGYFIPPATQIFISLILSTLNGCSRSTICIDSIFIHTQAYKFRQEESSLSYYQTKNSVSS
jgi:hypothetical protein